MKSTRISLSAAAALVTAALAAGCTTIEQRPVALDKAGESVRAAMADPHVPRFAPAQLNRAGLLLGEAERQWAEGADREVVLHHAYLADRQARIALETARARAARAEVGDADAQRRQIIADARRAQAEIARKQAEDERMRAEDAREAAEAARRQADQQLAQARAASEREALEREQAEQQIRRLEAEMKELEASRTARGWELTLGSELLFDVGRAELKPGAHRALDNLARFLQSHPERSVTIEGFTDSTGSEETNFALSLERAQAVKRALVGAGVDPSRVNARGYGEALPVASNDTVAGRQLNRRVEVVIHDPNRMAAGS